jgi:hypothetical protein
MWKPDDNFDDDVPTDGNRSDKMVLIEGYKLLADVISGV